MIFFTYLDNKKNIVIIFSFIVPEDMLLIFLVNHMFIRARLYFKNGYAKKSKILN